MKSKTTAALLAFFLGGFGVHRFYLGQTGLGFLYLIFIWTFIPAFIALIDFIIFLTMDEMKFNAKYNMLYMAMMNQQQQPTHYNNVINVTQPMPPQYPMYQQQPVMQPPPVNYIPDVCPQCKNPNTRRTTQCEWCGTKIA